MVLKPYHYLVDIPMSSVQAACARKVGCLNETFLESKSPHTAHYFGLQIASRLLFPLNSLKQTFEIASSESIKVIPLDDLNENSRPIHQWLRE